MPKNSAFQIDLERTANAPITEGIHVFIITDADEGQKTNEDGSPVEGSYPYWRFTCACQTPSEEGKTVDMIMSLSPKARWRMEDFLDAVGAPDSGSATMGQFLKRKFRGKIVHEDYNGRPQARIHELFRVTSSKQAVPATVVSKAKGAKKVTADPIAEEADEIEFEE